MLSCKIDDIPNALVYKYSFVDDQLVLYSEEDDVLSRLQKDTETYEVSRHDKKFTGKWFTINEDEWFEIKKNHTFNYAVYGVIDALGNWRIDTDKQLFTFLMPHSSRIREFKYEFEDSQLVLSTEEDGEVLRLEKK